jgi:hypothetical protein
MLPTAAICEMSSQEVIAKFNKIRLLIRAALKRLFPDLQFVFTFFRDTKRGQYDVPPTTGTAFRATRVECAVLVYEYCASNSWKFSLGKKSHQTSRLPLGGSYAAAEFITYEDEHELLLMVNKVVFLYSVELIRLICHAWKPKQLLDKTPVYVNPRYQNNMLYFTEEDFIAKKELDSDHYFNMNAKMLMRVRIAVDAAYTAPTSQVLTRCHKTLKKYLDFKT